MDDATVGGVSHGLLHPMSVQLGQSVQILVLGEHLSLETAHSIAAGGMALRVSPSNGDSHGRVLGQPFGIVGVLVTRQTAVHRLPEQGHQLMLHVATGATFLQVTGGPLRQSLGFVHITGRQQPSVGGDGGASKLHLHAAIKSDFQRRVGAFTRQVPPVALRLSRESRANCCVPSDGPRERLQREYIALLQWSFVTRNQVDLGNGR